MKAIVAATGNRHKLDELSGLLVPRGIAVVPPAEVGGIPDVEETGLTFAENAILKARAAAEHTGRVVMAEDSGLEVMALNRDPGVRSARYAGPNASDAERMDKLLGELTHHRDRSARFVCVIAICAPHGLIGTATGEVRGRIADSARGTAGFGYDPVFIPEGYDRTFGELGETVKSAMSHRGAAVACALGQRLFDHLGAD